MGLDLCHPSTLIYLISMSRYWLISGLTVARIHWKPPFETLCPAWTKTTWLTSFPRPSSGLREILANNAFYLSWICVKHFLKILTFSYNIYTYIYFSLTIHLFNTAIIMPFLLFKPSICHYTHYGLAFSLQLLFHSHYFTTTIITIAALFYNYTQPPLSN